MSWLRRHVPSTEGQVLAVLLGILGVLLVVWFLMDRLAYH